MLAQETRPWKPWTPALAYMALIWTLSSFRIVEPRLIELFPLRDKGIHVVEYAVLCFLLLYAMRRTWPDQSWYRLAFFSLGLTVFWGTLDELHQSFVPGRDADITDLAADTLGGAVGALANRLIQRKK